MSRYRIRKIVTSSGERLMFFVGDDGMPMHDVMVYSLYELRARNLSSNTIENALRAIQVLYLYLDVHGYSLVELIRSEKIAKIELVESLVQFSKKYVKDIERFFSKKIRSVNPKITSIEKFRAGETQNIANLVNSGIAAMRIIYIRNYIISTLTRMIYQEQFGSINRNRMIELRKSFETAINAKIPTVGRYRGNNERLALTPEESNEFLRVISPTAEDNPWSNEYAKMRNELLLLWFYHLGIRRGEALSVRIADILFQEGRVIIHRSADDPHDPRVDQPLQKTNGRKLALSEDLLCKTEIYIRDWRSQAHFAHKHLFLFTAINGGPMSISSVTKIFKVLRAKCPQLPHSLFAHILRHSFNTRFSELADKNNMPEHEEIKARSYLMGWSENSGTASIYTQRHIRKKANAASLKLQEELSKREKDERQEK